MKLDTSTSKIAGIMQPYFFPYLGYFSLIKHTNIFILFDPVQFIRHGWIDRNRVLKQGEGWQYISVPLQKHALTTLIKDVKISTDANWKKKIFAQLTHYKKKAPFYNRAMTVVEEALSIDTDSITILNRHILMTVCSYLNIPVDILIFSEMNLKFEPVQAPDEWALNICKALGNVNEYWNPPGGMEFFDREKYEKEQIKLYFQKINLSFYSQRRGPENFEPGLSIIDVMMFCSPEQISGMLDDYELL